MAANHKEKRHTVQMGIMLPPDMKRAMVVEAGRQDISIAELIRRAVGAYLAEGPQP